MAKKYKVVRSYDDGTTMMNELQYAFDEGWQFERASEYVPSRTTYDGILLYGYIEYVLSKEVENEK